MQKISVHQAAIDIHSARPNTRFDESALSVLIDAEKNHLSATLRADEKHPINGLDLVGFDYDTMEILLVASSRVALAGLLRPIHCWAQIKGDGQYLNVFGLVTVLRDGLISIAVERFFVTNNQRWNTRLSFDPLQGPPLRLYIKGNAPINGTIKNLSAAGAAIDVYGQDIRSQIRPGQVHEAHIRFNEQFSLTVAARVSTCDYKRKPCCHSCFRLTFPSQSTLSWTQLRGFVEGFELSECAA